MRETSVEEIGVRGLKPCLMNSADALLDEGDRLGGVEWRELEPRPERINQVVALALEIVERNRSCLRSVFEPLKIRRSTRLLCGDGGW